MDYSTFSKNLRKLRIEKAYTQEQAAEKLGVSAQSVSRWECGNTLPDVMLLPEIARLYGVTVDDLYKEDALAYSNYAIRLLSVYEASGKSEDFIAAEREFLKLLETEDHTPNDLRSFGVLYHYMMQWCAKQAEHWLDEVIGKTRHMDEENYYRTCQQKIALLSQSGRNEENIGQQSAALEKEMDNPNQWVLLISAYYHGKHYEKAYELAVKAMGRFPDNGTIPVCAGDACRALKKYDEAFSCWKKAIETDSAFLDAKFSMGFCYEEIGEYAKAYQIWKELAEELEERGLTIEKDFPLQLANKCREKMD